MNDIEKRREKRAERMAEAKKQFDDLLLKHNADVVKANKPKAKPRAKVTDGTA